VVLLTLLGLRRLGRESLDFRAGRCMRGGYGGAGDDLAPLAGQRRLAWGFRELEQRQRDWALGRTKFGTATGGLASLGPM
jgi:hypothetical protein